MIEVARQAYPDRDTLMRDLAELVADQLRAAHAGKGHATLAVPGGTTPGPFLEALAEADLAWADVRVLPTDERMVSELSSRSNARLIRGTLLKGRAAAAQFVDMYEPILGARRARVAAVLPIDVLVLGMGADMHTASLFPGAPELGAALAEDAPEIVEITPPGQPEARLTLSAPVLRGAGVIHILITGADKVAALEAALKDGPVAEAPVRAVLTAPAPVTVHYAE
ncbi:MAG TPA: 6-phosphogluconolactonase [Amaricoccus sp.]|nr:6-phosphogluconolactonase [Amaricoccus sp.]